MPSLAWQIVIIYLGFTIGTSGAEPVAAVFRPGATGI